MDFRPLYYSVYDYLLILPYELYLFLCYIVYINDYLLV